MLKEKRRQRYHNLMKMNQSDKLRTILLHISLIPRVGPAVVERLVGLLGKDALAEIYTWQSTDFQQRARLSPSLATTLVQGLADTKIVDEELTLLGHHAISWVTLFDDDYPEQLSTIHLPPLILYWRGKSIVQLSQGISFVGSRQANIYAYNALKLLIPPLVAHDWSVISGGAMGADTMAHKLAMEAGGSTVAVIGSGLLRLYPSQNRSLFDAIVDNNGTLLSCFPLRMNAVPGNFPARNRIIAGLSRAVIVVQAAARSGALITASFALEQGREVGAVPGPITDELSAGCHHLVRQGAALIADSNDIFAMIGQSSPPINSTDKFDEGKQDKHEDYQMVLPQISEQAQLVVKYCKVPHSFEEIIAMTNIAAGELQSLLCDLQLEGIIEQTMNGFWQLSQPWTKH
jgi:DNA processing protein